MLSRDSHRPPIELLSDGASLVRHPRTIAFLHDVRWCVTGDRGRALTAIEAHTRCATEPATAAEHR